MGKPFDRINVMVVDGVGCGESKDAKETFPEDQGANSLVNTSRVKRIDAPGLQGMGLEFIPGSEGIQVVSRVSRDQVQGAFGALEPTFPGKGSPEGHQALMGQLVEEPYLVFDRTGIPKDVIELVEASVRTVTGRSAEAIRYPGTDDISGTIFINQPGIGDRHYESRDPSQKLWVPTYASSDSVVQVALHQEVVPQSQIEGVGMELRQRLNQEGFRVGRVIMRPFVGSGDPEFTRVSSDRRDYGMDPDKPTLVNHLAEAGIPVHSVGKASDMLNHSGFSPERKFKLKSDQERIAEVHRRIREEAQDAFGFINLVGTDELYGHRRNPEGYADHIALMDETIRQILKCMGEKDLLIVTADHGCDPTHEAHTNHTRERAILLAGSPRIKRPINLGQRKSFADVAATIAENYGIRDKVENGQSFLPELLAA